MRNFRSDQRSPPDLINSLPLPGPTRWSAREKAAVVVAVRSGKLSLSEAFDRYSLSPEEFSHWQEAFDRSGIAGLQSKALVSERRNKLARGLGFGRKPVAVAANSGANDLRPAEPNPKADIAACRPSDTADLIQSSTALTPKRSGDQR